MKKHFASGLAFVLFLMAQVTLFSAQRWVLPVADGGPKPSPPSVHGYLTAAAKEQIAVKPDSGDGTTVPVVVQLTTKTQLFTTYGGFLTSSNLRPGQYAWVWYVAADPAKTGTPPRAAVVMLYSESPSDKPSQKIRTSFDGKN